jgi:predicted nucleic acid-binding protein
MTMVVDASVAASWVFPDEIVHATSDSLLRARNGESHAPWLFWYEIRNAILLAEKRKRITSSQANEFFIRVQELDIILDDAPDEDRVLTLARTHGLTVYDAAYLELAVRLSAPLVTLDGHLRQAATKEGVALLASAH